jgi:methionine aminotransferase
MSKLAADEGALNLSQGFPDFDSPPELIELVSKALKAGENQYAPMAGLIELREQIAAKTEKLYDTSYDPESEITITAGATQAIFTAILASLHEDDEVIIFTPAYDCYEPAVELVGAKVVFVPLKAPDFKINWEEVKKVINGKTRMIIVNSPHNPTGAILSHQDLLELDHITQGSNIMILSDEVYEHMVFDGQRHESLARNKNLAERSFIISSFGKTYHTTGWKIGYCLAPKELMKEFRKTHQYNVFAVNRPIQKAYAAYLQNEAAYMELSDFYQEKRDLFVSLIEGSRFDFSPAQGSYFQMLSYDRISDEADMDFAVRLTKEHKIASIPISVFYNKDVDPKMLRFCFAKQNSTLEQAAEILHKI